MRNRTFNKTHTKLTERELPEKLPKRRAFEYRMAKALAAGAEFAQRIIAETGGLKRSRRMYRAMKSSVAPATGASADTVLEACFLIGVAGVSRAEDAPKELRNAGFRHLVQAQQRLIQALFWIGESERAKLFDIRTDVVGIGEKDWERLLTNCLAVIHTARLLQGRGLQVWFPKPKERADMNIALVATYQHRPGGLCVEIHGSRHVASFRVDEAEFGAGKKDLSQLAERTHWFARRYPGDWSGIRVLVGFRVTDDGLRDPKSELPVWIVSDRRRKPRLVPPVPESPGETLAACG